MDSCPTLIGLAQRRTHTIVFNATKFVPWPTTDTGPPGTIVQLHVLTRTIKSRAVSEMTSPNNLAQASNKHEGDNQPPVSRCWTPNHKSSGTDACTRGWVRHADRRTTESNSSKFLVPGARPNTSRRNGFITALFKPTKSPRRISSIAYLKEMRST